MIRLISAFCLFVCALGLPTRASAQLVDPPLVMRDPGAYARTFADAMALGGVRPMREAFQQLLGPTASLPAEVDNSLRIYESPDMIKPAIVSRVLDDVVLSDAYRVAYIYNYYGGNYWLFTRLEFVRISTTEWTLTRIAFADRWANVALATTPGFESAIGSVSRSSPNRR